MTDKQPDPPDDNQVEPGSSDRKTDSGSASFWSELKHRKVFRVASVYLVTGWIIIQVASSTFENFGIPLWAFRFVALMVLLGLPVAIILTWAFELTPEGIKTTKSARSERGGKEAAPDAQTKRNWIAYATGALVPTLIFGALAGFFYFQARDPASEPAIVEAEPAQIEEATMSIAMMPLINMSSNEENAYFAGGIHEDVLTNLSRIDDLKVVSRTTMLRYAASELTLPEIGEALGADYIVEGSVRRIGNHVRVTVQLINARNDEHLWASNYERELVDVFATQSELAREISNSLHLELRPESVGVLEDMPTTSVRAYDLYLRSISLEKTEGDTEESNILRRDWLEQAVAEDPDFVEAWALLKRTYDLMAKRTLDRGWYLSEGTARDVLRGELKEKARRALSKAVTLDPENVETLISTAVDHVWPQPLSVMQERRRILDHVIETYPENAMAWYHLAWWHRHSDTSTRAEASSAFEEALKRDPFNARMVSAALLHFQGLGDQENVTRLAERLTQIIPETAEDRQLARIPPGIRLGRLAEAFVETADVSLISEYQKAWEAGHDDFRNKLQMDSAEVDLRIFTNDQERLIGLDANLSATEWSSAWDSLASFEMNLNALCVQWIRGETGRAEDFARRIVDAYGPVVTRYGDLLVSALNESYAIALVVLGDRTQAEERIDSMFDRPDGLIDPYSVRAINALSWLDVDRAAQLALDRKETHPDWRGLDRIAAYHINFPHLLLHPDIQAYYVKEGKWVDYLAERVPEYSRYVDLN